MNDVLNRLQAWMRMYDQQNTGDNSQAYGLNMHPPSRSSLRDEWARQMMDREDRSPMPGGDYFNFDEERPQMPQQQAVSPIRGDLSGLQQPQRNRLLMYMGGR